MHVNNTDKHIAPPFLEVQISYSILNFMLGYVVVYLFRDDNSWYQCQSTNNGSGPQTTWTLFNVIHDCKTNVQFNTACLPKPYCSHQSLTRQAIHVERNTESCPRNHSCIGKAIRITYSEYVFAALGTLHVMRTGNTVVWDLSGCTICFHIISQTARFLKRKKKKKLLGIKCVFWFSVQLFSETYFIPRRSERQMTASLYCSSYEVPVIIVWL